MLKPYAAKLQKPKVISVADASVLSVQHQVSVD